MTSKLTRAQWIAHANEVHGNRYDYSKVVYLGQRKPVTIICPLHGEFEQRSNNHVNCGHGCPKCGDQIKQARMTGSTEAFIAKAKLVHGNRYDYGKTRYINSYTDVTITCRIHGDFDQRPNNHTNGSNCPRCRGLNKTTSTVREDTMDIRLSKRNYRDDIAQAILQEHGANYSAAALSYKKAQHHAASANMLDKAKFAMARRIHCLKQADDPQWKQVNAKFAQLYQVLEAN